MEGITTPAFGFERVALGQEFGKLSPGSIFGNRIALGPNEEKDVFWATGSKLFRLSLGPAPTSAAFVPNYSGKLLLPPPTERQGSSVVLESVGGAKHFSEVQNLCFVSGSAQLLYSVDSTGQILMNRFNGGEHVQAEALERPASAISEHGWVGVAANENFPGVSVSARYCDKLVTVYDGERSISKFRTVGHPTQVKMLDSGLLAMTEQGSYSLWDLRLPPNMTSPHSSSNDTPSLNNKISSDFAKLKLSGVGSSGNCVQRVYVSQQILYSLDNSGTKVLVAGAERSAVVYDIRGDGPESRWGNCLKYDVTRARFAKSDPSLCYVSGLDNELLVGKLDGTSSISHFDGPHIESHWLGICNDNASDNVFGLAQSGHIFVCKNVPSILQHMASTATSKIKEEKIEEMSVQPHQRQVKQKKIQPPPQKKPKYEEQS